MIEDRTDKIEGDQGRARGRYNVAQRRSARCSRKRARSWDDYQQKVRAILQPVNRKPSGKKCAMRRARTLKEQYRSGIAPDSTGGTVHGRFMPLWCGRVEGRSYPTPSSISATVRCAGSRRRLSVEHGTHCGRREVQFAACGRVTRDAMDAVDRLPVVVLFALRLPRSRIPCATQATSGFRLDCSRTMRRLVIAAQLHMDSCARWDSAPGPGKKFATAPALPELIRLLARPRNRSRSDVGLTPTGFRAV